MRIAAFDLSLTASGFAIAVDGALKESGVIPGTGTDVPRMIGVRTAVLKRVIEENADLVFFEDLPSRTFLPYAKENAGLSFMVRAALIVRSVKYVMVSPTSLKKFIVGRSGSPENPVKKELVIKEIFKRFGADVDSNDRADAIGLAYLGMATVGEWTPQTDPQRDVIKKVIETSSVLRKLLAERQAA